MLKNARQGVTEDRIMKKNNAKTYIGIVIAAILALLLANPGWLPLPDDLRAALLKTEQENLLFRNDAHATIAQLITLVLAVLLVWLMYQVLRLILNALAKRGGRTQTVVNLITSVRNLATGQADSIEAPSVVGVDVGAAGEKEGN